MNSSFPKILFVLFLSFLVSACSVVKQDGIYQSKKYKHRTTNNWKAKHKRTSPTAEKTATAILPTKGIGNTMVASAYSAELADVSRENPKISKKDLKQLLNASLAEGSQETLFTQRNQRTQNDSCDLLVLTNGDEIDAKVTEISSSEIKYKRCNHLNGPTIIIDKSDVLFVKYSNGEKEVFTAARQTRPQPQQQRVESQPEVQDSGSPALRGVGIVLLIIGILFILVVSILLGLLISGFGLLFMAVGKK